MANDLAQERLLSSKIRLGTAMKTSRADHAHMTMAYECLKVSKIKKKVMLSSCRQRLPFTSGNWLFFKHLPRR